MKKRTIVASIVGSAFLLGVGVAVVNANFDSNASAPKKVATKGEVSIDLEDIEEGEVPEYFNILCTIKTKTVSYAEVANKDLVLCYDVNDQYEGMEKMTMQVEEYEADGTTPKTVYFESEVVGRQCAWIPYTVFTIDKDQVYDKIFCNTFSVPREELDKYIFENEIYKAGFKNEEKASTYDTVVKLQSSELLPADCEDEIYTALTYKINDGEEKTIYAHKEVNIRPGTAIVDNFTYDALIFANKGDKIEYKVTVPTKDRNAVYEDTKTVVVE